MIKNIQRALKIKTKVGDCKTPTCIIKLQSSKQWWKDRQLDYKVPGAGEGIYAHSA